VKYAVIYLQFEVKFKVAFKVTSSLPSSDDNRSTTYVGLLMKYTVIYLQVV